MPVTLRLIRVVKFIRVIVNTSFSLLIDIFFNCSLLKNSRSFSSSDLLSLFSDPTIVNLEGSEGSEIWMGKVGSENLTELRM